MGVFFINQHKRRIGMRKTNAVAGDNEINNMKGGFE